MRSRSLVVVIALMLLAIVPATVQAERPASAGPAAKVAICHRTGSTTNPWVKLTVAQSAWKAHEKHGDFLVTANRPCPPPTTTATSASTTTGTATSATTTTATPGTITTVTVTLISVSTVTSISTVTTTTTATPT